MASASQLRRAKRDQERQQQRILASYEQEEAQQALLETSEQILAAAQALAQHFGRPANKMPLRQKLARQGKGGR